MTRWFLTGAALAKDKVVRTEKLAERTGSNSIHRAGFEIDEDGTRDIFVARCLGED